ncbi:MAG: beta strand repeat-containing protein [Chthoniobacterales bacterium]
MKRIAISLAAIALTSLLLSQSAQAAARVWGNTGTDYNAGASWVGGVAPTTGDVGEFTAAEITQPALTASLSNSGLYFMGAASSGYDITAAAGITLTLTGRSTSGSSGTSDSSAAAIRADNTSGTNTIDVPLILAPTTGSTFVQAAGGTLVINGAISNVAPVNLSLRGGGTIQLNGSNSFATGSIDGAGEVVVIGNDNALGAGTFTVGATGTLQAGGGARTIANNIVVGGSTTLSGSNAFTFNGSVTSSGSNSRTLTVSNTGGAILNGPVFLSDSNTAARSLTINGSSTVVINGVITNNNVGNTLVTSLSYSGTGTLTLANSNTYGGGTFISNGTVIATHDGAFGSGNITLSTNPVILTLQGATNNYIADTANVNIQIAGDTVNLNFTGSDLVGSLTVAGTQEPVGVYGSATSGAPNVLPQFNGTGTFTVLTQIPEPATYMLMGIGILVCAQQFRRRKS